MDCCSSNSNNPSNIGGFIHPVLAEIAMALSSITVVTNANLLRNAKI